MKSAASKASPMTTLQETPCLPVRNSLLAQQNTKQSRICGVSKAMVTSAQPASQRFRADDLLLAAFLTLTAFRAIQNLAFAMDIKKARTSQWQFLLVMLAAVACDRCCPQIANSEEDSSPTINNVFRFWQAAGSCWGQGSLLNGAV